MNTLLLAILLLISAGSATRIFKIFRVNFADFTEKLTFAVALGLGLIAYIIFMLGILGFFYKPVFIWMMVILALFGSKEIIEIIRHIFSCLTRVKLKWFTVLLLFFICVVTLFTYIGALAPPIGHDSLSYRLAQVRIFSEQHKLSYLPHTRESLWPYLIEMLYVLGLTVKSDILAKLIAWSFGLISALLLYVFGKEYSSREGGLFAAAIFLLTPAIFTQMTCVYVDIALAMYSFISLISILKYFKTNDIKWAILAGIFCGFILSIKYIGVIALSALLIVYGYNFINKKGFKKEIFKGFSIFILFTIIFSFAWYLRAYLIKGNPFYPFFSDFFANNGWQMTLESKIAKNFSLQNLILLPWNITMFPSKIGGENFGAVYLLFLPFLFFDKINKDKFNSLRVFAVSYTVIWFFVDQFVSRFLFAVLLALSMLIGNILADFFLQRRSYFKNFVKIIFVAVCLFNIGLAGYHNFDKVKVSLGLESREAYLSRVERTYVIAEYINKYTPKGATILMVNEIRSYYIKRPYIHLYNLIKSGQLASLSLTKSELSRMIDTYGIDYILYQEQPPYPWLSYLADYRKPLMTHSFIDKEGESYIYHLYSCKIAD